MKRSTAGMDSEEWTARAGRLERIVAAADVVSSFRLLQVVRMNEGQFARLAGTVTAYLWQSLNAAFSGRGFALDSSLVERHSQDLLNLPNRTPNGVVLPRRDTFLAFNLIHHALAEIAESLGVLAAFSHVQIPCNVRLVDGTPDVETDARSYASTKIHTDVWNGEPISSILFNIPVLGDPHAVDLRFYEPRRFPPELRRLLTDYTLGDGVAASVEEYRVPFALGHLYISDALSLHRTVKRAPAVRVSLDFRAIAAELLPGESAETSLSKALYVTPDLWRKAGTTTILASGEPVDAFQRRRAGEPVVKDTMALFDIDNA